MSHPTTVYFGTDGRPHVGVWPIPGGKFLVCEARKRTRVAAKSSSALNRERTSMIPVMSETIKNASTAIIKRLLRLISIYDGTARAQCTITR